MSIASLLLALLAVPVLVLLFVAAALLGSHEDDGFTRQPAAGKDLKAAVFCGGPSVSPRYHQYDGYGDCRAAAAVQGGDRACTWGCLGYGSCIEACPEGAIRLDETGRPQVSDACTACGRCIAVCPRDVIRLLPRTADVIVACSSKDTPAYRGKVCRHPCTACGICVTVNSSGGYRVDRQTALARVDYSKRGDRQAGQRACPKSCILPLGKAL